MAYKGLSTPGNKVAENGNRLLQETATLTGAATKLLFRATICCRFRKQFVAVLFVAVFGNFVAWCGQALSCRVFFRRDARA